MELRVKVMKGVLQGRAHRPANQKWWLGISEAWKRK